MSEHDSDEDIIKADANELCRELRLTYMTGAIGIGKDEWHVYIYEKRKKPLLIKWKGRSVIYHIGGGIPSAWSS